MSGAFSPWAGSITKGHFAPPDESYAGGVVGIVPTLPESRRREPPVELTEIREQGGGGGGPVHAVEASLCIDGSPADEHLGPCGLAAGEQDPAEQAGAGARI